MFVIIIAAVFVLGLVAVIALAAAESKANNSPDLPEDSDEVSE